MADPLYRQGTGEPVDPVDAVHEVHRFLRRCRAWATERELPARRAQVQASDDPSVAAKLHGWLTYVRFLDHTLDELESGHLDPWFESSSEPSEAPSAIEPRPEGGAPTGGPV